MPLPKKRAKMSTSASAAVRAGGTLRLNVPNLAELQLYEIVYSPSYSIANLQWTLRVSQEVNDNIKGLAVYARCSTSNKSSDWRCEAKVRFSVLPQKDGKLPYTFDDATKNWGFSPFMEWDDILNPETGYIREDGGIVVEATITVSKVFIKEKKCDFSTPKSGITEDAIVIGEQRLYVSKQYLAMISPVFNKMFFGEFAEKDKIKIPLEDIDRDEFIELLHVIDPSRKQPSTTRNLFSASATSTTFVMRECEQLLCGDCKIPLEKKLLWADRYRLASLQFACLNAITTVGEAKKLKSTAEFDNFSPPMNKALLDRILMFD